jgi:hypothetical protein
MPPVSVWPDLLTSYAPLQLSKSCCSGQCNHAEEGLLSNSGQFCKELSRKKNLSVIIKDKREGIKDKHKDVIVIGEVPWSCPWA